MQFADAIAFSENGNGNINRAPSPPLPVSPPASPRPAAGTRGLPTPPRMTNQQRAHFEEIQRAQAENAARARLRHQAARNEELRRFRAIAPNAYEENGIMVIPAAGRRLAVPAPVRAALAPPRQLPVASLPPIRPTVREPEPQDPSRVNNSNNENINPRPPTRRSPRRRTSRRARKNSRHSRRR